MIPFLEKDEDSQYRPWEYVSGVYSLVIPNISEQFNPLRFALSKDERGTEMGIVSLPENVRDISFTDRGDLCAFTIENERWIALYKKNTGKFSGFFKDAKSISDTTFLTNGCQAYPLVFESESGWYYHPLKKKKKCSEYGIYKFTCDVNFDLNTFLENAKKIKNKEVTAFETGKNLLNCLKGRKAEFFKYIIERYKAQNIIISEADQEDLYNALVNYGDVRVNGVDGVFEKGGNPNETYIHFNDLISYGYQKLIYELSLSVSDLLIIDLENPKEFGELCKQYEAIISTPAIFNCIKEDAFFSNVRKLNKEDIGTFKFWVAVYEDVYNVLSMHDAIVVLTCLLKEAIIPEYVWNGNRSDYIFKDLDDNIAKALSTVIIGEMSLNIESEEWKNGINAFLMVPKLTLATCCGMWNSLVEQAEGIAEMAGFFTKNPIGQIKSVKETFSSLKNFSFKQFGETLLSQILEHHGAIQTNNGKVWDEYRSAYSVGYDLVFVASCFIGAGEVNAIIKGEDVGKVILASIKNIPASLNNARKSAHALIKNLPETFKNLPEVMKTVCCDLAAKVVETSLDMGFLISEDAKMFVVSSKMNMELFKLTENGIHIIDEVTDFNHVLYVSEIPVKVFDERSIPRTGFVCLTDKGLRVFGSDLFVDCLKKYTNKLGDDLSKFVTDFGDASDDVIRILHNSDDLVGAWERLRKIGISADLCKDIEALKAWNKLEVRDISKVNENVKAALRSQGLSDDEIGKLIHLNQRRASKKPNKDHVEVKICQEITEKCFPLPKEGDVITKLVSENDFFVSEYYFRNSNGTSVSGCIAKKSEFSMTNASLDDIVKYFGLDYTGNKFVGTNGYVKMEVVTTSDMLPYMTRPAKGMKNPERPQTLTGILGHETNTELLTPEYYLTNFCEIPDKSIATHFNKDGSVNFKYEYNEKNKRWVIFDNGDEASGLCKGLHISKEPFENFRNKLKSLGSKSKDFYNDFKNASEEIRMQFVNDFELIDNWAFCKGIHKEVAKDIEAIKHLKELRILEKSKEFGFTDDFLKEMKQAHSSTAPSWKQIWTSCETFIRNFDKKNIEHLEYVLGDLKKESNFMVGAEWTLRYVGNHADEFAGKKLIFESTENISDNIRRADLKVEETIVNPTGKQTTKYTFYEFKSVQEIPPYNFTEQFGKDLLNDKVNDLSQLKWVFDGKKVTQEQLVETMGKTIEEWNIPKDIKDKWITEDMTEKIFKNKLKDIFKAK